MTGPTFGPLSHPYPNTTALLKHVYETGELPTDITVDRSAFRAACARLLEHPDLPAAWRDDVIAILNAIPLPRTTPRKRA